LTTTNEFAALVVELTDSQRLKVLSLIKIALARPEARRVLVECSERCLDLDDALAEIARRLPSH
jgi:hypothetical protein